METLTLDEYILDETLEQQILNPETAEDFNKSITQSPYGTVRDCVTGQIRHKNYIEYLALAWKHHYGIVISPDIVWHIFMNEIATIIKEDPQRYRHLFTDSAEKKEIIVETADPELIDLNLIIEELRKVIPSNTDFFFPKFTTSTESSQMAFKAAFADSMSPFYNYGMFMCGIPKVRVLGNESDWMEITARSTGVFHYLENFKQVDYIKNFQQCVSEISNKKDPEFWKKIFRLERCGSGGQVEVKGWITKLFTKMPRPAYINNFPSCVSKVNYENKTTSQHYQLCHGLLGSDVKDGFLMPDFGYIINKKLAKSK